MTAQKETTHEETHKVPGPAPRDDAWRVIGPGGGGTMIMPTISPHDPNIALEHCDMTGAYITTDGGMTWRMFNLRTVVNTFAFDPNDRAVIYAGNAALWRSEDTGRTWSMVFPDPKKNTLEHMCGDHANYFLTSDDPTYPGPPCRIQVIAVDPANSNRLFIVLSGDPAALYVSGDRGASWTRTKDFARERIYTIHVQPARSEQEPVLYVVGEAGIYRGSVRRWEHLPAPPTGKIQSASVGTVGGTADFLIHVTTPVSWAEGYRAGGVYVSSDEGRSWRDSNASIMGNSYRPTERSPTQFRIIACAAQDALTAYVGFCDLRLGAGCEGIYNGIAKTTDGGQNWSVVHKESNRPSPNMEVSWIEGRAPDSAPNIWFVDPYSLGVAPTNPDVCYVTDFFRTYRTTNGGRTWQQVNSVCVGEGRWTTRGLDVTTCYGVHFDPFDTNHMFITYTDIGLFQSANGGGSWTGATIGIPNRWRNTTYWIECDPEVKDLIWGAFAFNHDLPRPKMWRHTDPADYRGGVAVSTDGGRHWVISNEGMPQTAVTHILLEPTSPVGRRVLYACAFGRGVYKSTDNGRSWTLKNKGIEKVQPFAWRLVLADYGTLYLILARRSDDGRIGDEDDGALYKSTDGAEHWVKMALPEGANDPTGLALDPADSQRMYLTAWGVYSSEGDTDGGIFLSTDGGGTWQNIFSGSQHLYDITIDPNNSKVLYVCGFDSAAYRSTDSGHTWTRIKGYNFKWGHRVMVDPLNADRIYITTFGGSVWHGPAAGDPNAVEDIVTPLSA